MGWNQNKGVEIEYALTDIDVSIAEAAIYFH